MRTLDAREAFLQKYYANENELFVSLRNLAKVNKCDHMIVAPSEARTLKFLVEMAQAKKVVEIGCLYGLSCMYMASAPSVSKIWTLEKNQENAKIAQSFFDQSSEKNKIQLLIGDAHDNLKQLNAEGPFDVVFIDADKSGYPNYVRWAYQNLRVGGLVICDNTFLGGSVWGEDIERKTQTQIKAMLEVHEELAQSGRWSAHTLPSFDGITVGIKL